jgi:uncharacterized membrane protein HdeD (DUF308 family)
VVGRDRVALNLLKQPGWLRGLEIITGLLAIVLGILVLVLPGWRVATLVALLSIGLIFAGIRSISLAGYTILSVGLRAVSAITGILSLILALLVLIFPGFAVLTLIIFVSFGLLVYGVGRVFLAYALKETIGWIRGMIAAVGMIDIILSVVVLALPNLALLTLSIILALVLLVSGAEMIVSGAIGRTWIGDLVKVAANDMDNK